MDDRQERSRMMSEDLQPGPAPRIGVVIPYFQREAGLLRRALSSVAAQQHAAVQVVVVDDGSPLAAAAEITPTLHDALPGLTIIRQPNQGVSAARNAAIAALAQDVSAVAFLDSDDYWQSAHLKNAAAALSLGADFFFSNSQVEGGTSNYFDEHPRRELLCDTASIPGAPGIVRWPGSVPELILPGCVFWTPGVVLRRGVMPESGFSRRFRRAGEDQVLFWEILTRSAHIMFSTEPTIVIGSAGLGTWRNSTYGSVAHLVRLADEIYFRRHAIGNFALSDGERRLLRSGIASRRYSALRSALHVLRRRRKGAVREVLNLFRSDPVCMACWCIDLPKLLYRKIRRTPVTTEWAG
jgi:succinoglycan biosynthesis protein ExoW